MSLAFGSNSLDWLLVFRLFADMKKSRPTKKTVIVTHGGISIEVPVGSPLTDIRVLRFISALARAAARSDARNVAKKQNVRRARKRMLVPRIPAEGKGRDF